MYQNLNKYKNEYNKNAARENLISTEDFEEN